MKYRNITKEKYASAYDKLEEYVRLIEEHNKSINLTGFKDDSLWELGILESLLSLETLIGINASGTLLDIGSGVGFPSIPYAIVNPNITVVIHEPLLKRVNFLKGVIKKLNLKVNVYQTKTENSKVDDYNYDYITARAVTSLKDLINMSIKKGKQGAIFGFIKGPKIYDEIEEAKEVIDQHQLNIEVIGVDTKNDKKTYIAKYKI